MAILSEKVRQQIQEQLKEMTEPVKLVHFTQEIGCELCPQIQQLLEELVSLSHKLSLEIFNFQIDKQKTAHYRVDKVPATIVEGQKDYGIRFYGLPAGYEFAVLLQDIIQVSHGKSGLSPVSIEKLRSLSAPTHLEVFVTPTCPYCPDAVRLAHQLAMENELITADMVEATEFPELSQRYSVFGVPKTVVNETLYIEGALPEEQFVQEVLDGVAMSTEMPSVGP